MIELNRLDYLKSGSPFYFHLKNPSHFATCKLTPSKIKLPIYCLNEDNVYDSSIIYLYWTIFG